MFSDEGDPEEHAAEQVDPVAEGVQAREGDVARADHQRHEVDAERLHHRHGEQEHHRRAVHGEELVVEVRPDELVLRPRELQAHRRGREPAEEEEDERGDEIAPRRRSCGRRVESRRDQARGRCPRSRRAARRSSAPSSMVSRRSRSSRGGERVAHFKPLEIGGERIEVVGLELDRRHVDARLDAVRVDDPGGEVAAAHRQRAGGEVSCGCRRA